ncbi:hypothetical protein GCM10007857_81200 [Bradyrhizobium iriomotense]|uniref:Uncharacterized protein n=1 Tax=Bradyrhizobium iriomotense TaxID=441950 RepID=A0ABQ6BH28_9BRAD|nr:hypothetical protein GCM10007857_81200 [Bradyrhizobium iriomotense]
MPSLAMMRPQTLRMATIAARMEWLAQMTVEMRASRYAETGV